MKFPYNEKVLEHFRHPRNVGKIENADGKLKSGMNTNIEITIINKENVLLAPATAINNSEKFQNNSKKKMVLLKKQNKFVPTEVEIGLSNFKHVEIVSGLTEGMILGIPMTSRLKEENERREDRIKSSRSFGSSG